MNAQERQLIDELFERLSRLEAAPRDGEAEAAILQGLRRAPNAAYALVQTVLVQDEALQRANARIEELEGHVPAQAQSGGFLDSMRDALFGSQSQRGSVPNVPVTGLRPQESSRPVWNSGQVNAQQVNAQVDPRYSGYGGAYSSASPQAGFGGGGSFLGTAAATAAGVIGGAMLMNSIRGLMGGGHQAFADSSGLGGNDSRAPWRDQSDSSLARDAGIDDIGRGGQSGGDTGSRHGLFDQASNDADDDDGDFDGDGFDSGDDSDTA